MNAPKRFTIRIADVAIALVSDARLPEWEIQTAYHPFGDYRDAEIVLGLYYGLPDIPTDRQVFDSAPIWTLHARNEISIYKIFQNSPGIEQWLLLSPDLRRAELYFDKEHAHFTGPLVGPAMELLMINYLSRTGGTVIHACGVEHRGKGYLFAGESGAGKSTLASLWDRQAGAAVLSDDRTVVRRHGGRLWMYGTPWHGEAPFGSPRGVELEKIFFLVHGPENAIETISAADVVVRLLQCSFAPFWDASGTEAAVALFEELATGVSCSELTFKPDDSAIGFLSDVD